MPAPLSPPPLSRQPPISSHPATRARDARQTIDLKESHGECTALSCSSDGRYIAMGSRGGGLAVWDLSEMPPRLVRKLGGRSGTGNG